MQLLFPECNAHYRTSREDRAGYAAGWSTKDVTNATDPWVYRSSDELEMLPYWGILAVYGGGGYVMEHGRYYEESAAAQKRVLQQGWIDQYTRVVLLELILYNPHVNLFAVVTLCLEVSASTAVLPHHDIHVLRLHSYTGSLALFTLICQVIFLLFLVQNIVAFVISVKKKGRKHFGGAWAVADFSLMLGSTLAVVMYAIRYILIRSIMDEHFTEKTGRQQLQPLLDMIAC